MSSDLGQFLKACGATGPLQFEWDDVTTGQLVRQDFERPAIVVGGNLRADLVLDHPRVGRRHAYLQLVEGRLFAIDLGSREGLRWDGVSRGGGWVDRNRPVQVGPTTIRLVGGDQPAEVGPGPGPTSRRYESRRKLPRAVLEFRVPGDETRRLELDRVLTLVGGSAQCRLRLPEAGASRVICALLLTPVGVWAVDLLSSKGVAVNGGVCSQALLADGDVLQAGSLTVRLTYGGLATPPRSHRVHPAAPASVSGSDRPDIGPLLPALIERPEVLLSPEVLGPLLQGAGPATDMASGPFGQALVLLVRLLGDMHRDHLKLVREELEQIRRINVEMNATQGALDPPADTRRAGAGPASTSNAPEVGDSGPEPVPPPLRVVCPEEAHSLVGERLAAWELERRSRWQRVIELLVKR